MKKIINVVTGETVKEIIGGDNRTLDELLEMFGEIFAENTDENVLIDGEWYYYDDLDVVVA